MKPEMRIDTVKVLINMLENSSKNHIVKIRALFLRDVLLYCYKRIIKKRGVR